MMSQYHHLNNMESFFHEVLNTKSYKEEVEKEEDSTIAFLCKESEELGIAEAAEYQGRKVTLNKPFRTPGESKKFAVYVKKKDGTIIIVRFGDPNMSIKKNNPERRKSFRARHKCDTAKDPTTPRYWSCRMWSLIIGFFLLFSNISNAQYTSPFIEEQVVSTFKEPVKSTGINPKTIPNTSPWTYPGEITNHLVTGHGLSYDQIKNLSKSDKEKLHNYLHNTSRQSQITRRFRLLR